MSTSPSSTSLPVRHAPASLSTLPLELRARICELAGRQDRVYRVRWELSDPSPSEARMTARHRGNVWRGRSLAALSETCRTFNALAAKHIFHTLHAEQLSSTYFLLRILPRHGTHIREVSFMAKAERDDEPLIRALAILSALPSLDRLVLEGQAATDLFNGTPVLGHFGDLTAFSNEQLNYEPFRAVAARLTHLELSNFESSAPVTAILRLAPALESVVLRNRNSSDELELYSHDEVVLVECLAGLASLRHFNYATCGNSRCPSLDGPWQRCTWAGPLTSIKLPHFHLNAASFAFIDNFAPTLQQLDVDLYIKVRDEPPPFLFFRHPFPSLTSLTITNCATRCFGPLIWSLTGDPNSVDFSPPPLRELRCHFTPTLPLPDLDTFLKITRHLNLSSVDFSNPFRSGNRADASVCAAAAAHLDKGVTVPAWSRPDPFIWRNLATRDQEQPETTRERLDRYHAGLQRALEFATRRVNRMHAHGDLGEMEVTFQALEEMRGLKLLEDD